MRLRDNIRFVLLIFACMLLSACDKEIGGSGPSLSEPAEDDERPIEDAGPEAEYLSPYVVSSAVMTFCYYDIQGQIDTLDKRIDFNLDVYGTDTPDLRNISLTFVTRDGFSARNAEDGVVTMTLSAEKPSEITFIKDTVTVNYDIYVTRTIKTASVTEFDLHAGVNLSYWFQEEVPWPSDEVLEQIKNYGFDHVRLPVDTHCLFDQSGNIRQNIMTLVHHVIEKCLDLGLNVIYDMHWLEAGNLFYSEPAANELVNNWKKLMEELGGYPEDRLAYEILNEPYGPGWGLMQRRMLHLIRHFEPERVVFVSPDGGYGADPCAEFHLHGGDPNLIMTFHYYEPMLASHKKIWGYTGPSHYPGLLFSDEEWEAMTDAEKERAQWHRGAVYDYDYVHAKMEAVAAAAAKNGLKVHCGEFGMSKTNIREERLQWFRDIVRAFSSFDIPFTVWESWGGDFGPGTDWGTPDEETIGILLGAG